MRYFIMANDCIDDDPDIRRSQLLEWVLYMFCKAHGCSNSVVWSLKHEYGEAQNADDAHIAILRLINCSAVLHGKVDEFLMIYLEFVPGRDHDPAQVRAFWLFLLVCENWLAVFVVADPFWDGKKLRVN